jgi:hypothetical protein
MTATATAAFSNREQGEARHHEVTAERVDVRMGPASHRRGMRRRRDLRNRGIPVAVAAGHRRRPNQIPSASATALHGTSLKFWWSISPVGLSLCSSCTINTPRE